MACRAKMDGLPAEFYASKDPQRRNMPIYCHFLSKSEYQLEKNLFKHVAFSALSQNASPPCSMTIPSYRQGEGGLSSVLLRQKVMLCYDTNRFLNSCTFFEIFR